MITFKIDQPTVENQWISSDADIYDGRDNDDYYHDDDDDDDASNGDDVDSLIFPGANVLSGKPAGAAVVFNLGNGQGDLY